MTASLAFAVFAMCAAPETPTSMTLRFSFEEYWLRSARVLIVSSDSSLGDAARSIKLPDGTRVVAGAEKTLLPRLSLRDGIVQNVLVADHVKTLVATMTELHVQRKSDGRQFAIPYLKTPPFAVGQTNLGGTEVEIPIGPVQLVRVRVRDRFGKGVVNCRVEVLDEDGSVASDTNNAGELWLLLSPGPYEISAERAARLDSTVRIGEPTANEVTVDLMIQ
jgi:hypothetical protein